MLHQQNNKNTLIITTQGTTRCMTIKVYGNKWTIRTNNIINPSKSIEVKWIIIITTTMIMILHDTTSKGVTKVYNEIVLLSYNNTFGKTSFFIMIFYEYIFYDIFYTRLQIMKNDKNPNAKWFSKVKEPRSHPSNATKSHQGIKIVLPYNNIANTIFYFFSTSINNIIKHIIVVW